MRTSLRIVTIAPAIASISLFPVSFAFSNVRSVAARAAPHHPRITTKTTVEQLAWVQGADGEWEWEEDDPNFVEPTVATAVDTSSTATPQLPSGKLKPKQSLGQNFLKDPNTVAKIVRAFHNDATRDGKPLNRIVELGPGAGALTDRLVDNYGTNVLQCIEVDPRAVDILNDRYPALLVHHADVLQVNYPEMAQREGQPLVVIGNLPYYITSQILFALADASHYGAVDCATVTMQWEVAQRMVAPTSCKVCFKSLLVSNSGGIFASCSCLIISFLCLFNPRIMEY